MGGLRYVPTGEVVSLPRRIASRVSEHACDALAAALTFAGRAKHTMRSDLAQERVLSLVGLHLLVCGISKLAIDRSLLTEPCVVIKARKPQ